jgi:hypothetical protein
MRVTAKAFPSVNEQDGVLVPANFIVVSERRAGVRFVMAMLHSHPQIKWCAPLLPEQVSQSINTAVGLAHGGGGAGRSELEVFERSQCNTKGWGCIQHKLDAIYRPHAYHTRLKNADRAGAPRAPAAAPLAPQSAPHRL